MNGLISVIIPVYNARAYLAECLDSILAQTYRNTEILLIDDGSTDGSGELCGEYAKKDSRVRVLRKANGGASSARNAGLRAATGEYVYFLDSDDRVAPELLEKLHRSAEENQSELVFFDAYTVEEETGAVSRANYSHKEAYPPDTGRNMIKKLVANGDFHMGICLLFCKKELLDRHSLTFTEGIVYEDFLFSCQAYCLANRVSYVPEFLYCRRYRKNSVMTSKKVLKNYDSAATVYKGVRDFSERNGGVVPPAYLVRGAYNVLTCYRALSREEKKRAKLDFLAQKKDILAHRAYGDTALRLSCYGKPLWAAYRVFEKMFR